MGAEGLEGAEEDEGAAVYILLDGQDNTGIGYIALLGFGAKCVSGLDTPQTVTTTRAPAVLIMTIVQNENSDNRTKRKQ